MRRAYDAIGSDDNGFSLSHVVFASSLDQAYNKAYGWAKREALILIEVSEQRTYADEITV